MILCAEPIAHLQVTAGASFKLGSGRLFSHCCCSRHKAEQTAFAWTGGDTVADHGPSFSSGSLSHRGADGALGPRVTAGARRHPSQPAGDCAQVSLQPPAVHRFTLARFSLYESCVRCLERMFQTGIDDPVRVAKRNGSVRLAIQFGASL